MSHTHGDPGSEPGRLDDATDETLLARLAAGRLDALDTLYDRYRSMAFGLARRISADDALAEDVVQEAFLGAWRAADRYVTGKGSVRTWLLSIVHHRAIDALRRRRPTSELPDELEGARTPDPLVTPDVWREVAGNLDRAAVLAALNTLSDVQREALELAYFSGLTQVEIAERTGVPLGTVKGRVRLALQAMRRALDQSGVEGGP